MFRGMRFNSITVKCNLLPNYIDSVSKIIVCRFDLFLLACVLYFYFSRHLWFLIIPLISSIVSKQTRIYLFKCELHVCGIAFIGNAQGQTIRGTFKALREDNNQYVQITPRFYLLGNLKVYMKYVFYNYHDNDRNVSFIRTKRCKWNSFVNRNTTMLKKLLL